jgi:hypothetical protein
MMRKFNDEELPGHGRRRAPQHGRGDIGLAARGMAIAKPAGLFER